MSTVRCELQPILNFFSNFIRCVKKYEYTHDTWSGGRSGRFWVSRPVKLGLVLPRREFLERRRFGLLQHAHNVRAVSIGHGGGHCVSRSVEGEKEKEGKKRRYKIKKNGRFFGKQLKTEARNTTAVEEMENCDSRILYCTRETLLLL